MSIDAAAQIATAALDAGIAPLARVPNGEYSIATRLARQRRARHRDAARGHRAEAREVVEKLKYRRFGHRSMGGTARITGCAPPAPVMRPRR